MPLILDGSGLLAAIDGRQEDHARTREFLNGTHDILVISPFVLAELDYMIMTRFGQGREIALLNEVSRGAYHLEPFSSEDVSEAVEVIENYADLGVGLADASNVVLSKRYQTNDLLTLDERHFRTLRGYGDLPFRVLPADA